jgi:methyl-accepting chemotaxis protein
MVFQLLSSTPIHLLITGSLLAALLLFFVFGFGWPAWRQGLLLGRVLRRLESADLRDSRDPEALEAAFPQRGEVQYLWREYRKTLYAVPEAGSTGVATVRWSATAPAEVVWNPQLAVDQKVRAEFFKHLPGIFTGLGIIGTFFGLIEGLRRFQVSSDAEIVRGSLESLMHSVGEAFLISAGAITLAIVVTFIEKLTLSSLNGKVDAIAASLGRRFPAAVAERFLEEAAAHTEETATQLKHLKGELLRDLRPVLQELSDRHTQTLERLAEALRGQLAAATEQQIVAHRANSEALGGTVSGAITGSLAGPLDDIKKAVQQASGDQSAAAVRMLQDVMASFSQRLNDLFGGQIAGINELNQRTAQTMQDAVVRLGELVASLQDAGRQSSEAMAGQMAKAIAEMEARQAAITQTTQALVGELGQAIERSQRVTAEGVRSTTDEMARRMAEAIEKMERRQDAINERTREFVEQIRALVVSSQDETRDRMQATLQTLGEQLGALLRDFRNAQAEVLDNGRRREEETAARVQSTVNGLTGSVQTLIEQLVSTAGRLEESVTVLHSAATTAISGLGDGAEQVNAATRNLASASDKVVGAMNHAATTATQLAGLSGSMSAAAAALQQGFEEYRAHREAVGRLVDELNALVANAKTDISITSDVLRRIEAAASALGKAQQQTEQFMQGVAEVLGEAHRQFSDAMLRTVSENNREFHRNLSSAVGLLSSSVKELDAVLSGVTPQGRRQ